MLDLAAAKLTTGATVVRLAHNKPKINPQTKPQQEGINNGRNHRRRQ